MKSNTMTPEKKDHRLESIYASRIELDDLYFVTRDADSWKLHYSESKGINEKTGKETISEDYWYFPTFKLCLKKYCDRVLMPCKDILEINLRIDLLNRKIDQLCKD